MRRRAPVLLSVLLACAGCQTQAPPVPDSRAFEEPGRLTVPRQLGSSSQGASSVRANVRSEALTLLMKQVEFLERQPMPKPDGSTFAWGEAWTQMGLLAAFEGTDDPAILEVLTKRIDYVLANRDDLRGVRDEVRGRVMPAWSTDKYWGKRYCWSAHVGMITYPIARCVYAIRARPRLARQFGARADAYLKAVIKIISAFDSGWTDGPGKDEGFYFLDGMEARRELPFNGSDATGRTLVTLYLLTGENMYRDRATRVANYLKHRLQCDDQAYVWPYWPGKPDIEDVSHGSIDADFAFVCYRAGIVFTVGDMRRFAATFHRIVKVPGFAQHVDGSGKLAPPANAGTWLHMAWFDFRLADIMLEHARGEEEPNVLTLGYLIEVCRPLTMDRPCRLK